MTSEKTPSTGSVSCRLLPLAESLNVLGSLETQRWTAPPTLHQYWDHDPPKQITRLLDHNAHLCRRWGLPHKVWDKTHARAFLTEYFPQYLELFESAPHPAMGSDLLRLCLLSVHGGLYLDADMALRKIGGEQLAGLLHEVLLFKWTHADRNNLPNWCFGFRAGHPMLTWMLQQTADAIDTALSANPEQALADILMVSGPGRFTRLAGSWIAEHGPPPGLLLRNVSEAYTMVQNGPDLLKAPLAYKSTSRHWLVAARG